MHIKSDSEPYLPPGNTAPSIKKISSTDEGITGWAQVNGLRGSDTCIRTRVEYDLHYMQNWNFYFDIRIIAMTLVSGVIAKNGY